MMQQKDAKSGILCDSLTEPVVEFFLHLLYAERLHQNEILQNCFTPSIDFSYSLHKHRAGQRICAVAQ